MKYLSYFILLLIGFASCSQHRGWADDQISKKLKAVFPEAGTIHILDSNASKKDTTDRLDMPLPVYKAFVSEKQDTNQRFVFFFYNVSSSDTAYHHIFQQCMLNMMRAGLGTAKSEYLNTLPQLNYTGNKALVYAVSLNISDNKYIIAKEKKIRSEFGLTETKIRDVKLEELKDNKQ